MAKDDYDYLMFKILTYLYVCFRRRGYFETSTFLKKCHMFATSFSKQRPIQRINTLRTEVQK